MNPMDIYWNETMNVIRLDIALALLMGLFAFLGLSACDLETETSLSHNRMQVQPDQFFEQVPVSAVDESYVDRTVIDYRRQGAGPMDLTVTYDPVSKSNTAMKASARASDIAAVFARRGLADVKASILPVQDQGDGSSLMVSYDSYKALPPRDCPMMRGAEDRDFRPEEDYRLGCTLDTVMARQIRPKDLAGRESADQKTDGRRNANIVEVYRTGTPNKALEGETASK